MKIEIENNYGELSKKAALLIAEYINGYPNTLVCLAAGNTPLGAFEELVAMHNRNEVDLSSVYYIGLDEWIGLGINDEGSCVKVMHDAIYKHISKDRVLMFDGLDADTKKQCRKAEDLISHHGGIGFTLLGIGMNGHIGFNEPGTPDTDGCFTVALDDVTKSVGKKYFDKEQPITTGITIGWRTLYNAKNVALMASGFEKAPIVKKSIKGPITPNIPASLFQDHKNINLILDKDAASLL